jgi:hypothetical protein
MGARYSWPASSRCLRRSRGRTTRRDIDGGPSGTFTSTADNVRYVTLWIAAHNSAIARQRILKTLTVTGTQTSHVFGSLRSDDATGSALLLRASREPTGRY